MRRRWFSMELLDVKDAIIWTKQFEHNNLNFTVTNTGIIKVNSRHRFVNESVPIEWENPKKVANKVPDVIYIHENLLYVNVPYVGKVELYPYNFGEWIVLAAFVIRNNTWYIGKVWKL